MQEFDEYGIDFTGPIPLDGDEMVVVDELGDILSSAQKAALRQQLDSVDSSSHEGIISRFTIAKGFVHEAQNA